MDADQLALSANPPSIPPPAPPFGQAAAGNTDLAIASLLQRCLTNAPLRSACEAGEVDRVQQALKSVGVLANNARSGLQVAIAKGHVAVVRHLLDEGVPAEPVPPQASGPLTPEQRAEAAPFVIQAAMSGSVETLRALLDHNVSVNQTGHVAVLDRGHGARAVHASLVAGPLSAAAWAMKYETLEVLADQLLTSGSACALDAAAELRPLSAPAPAEAGATRQSRPAAGRLQDFAWAQGATPLVLAVHAAGRAAAVGNDLETPDALAASVVDVLLRRRANPDARNAAGETALHAAARFGLHRVTGALLRGGADASQRNAQGDTAEAVASRAGRTACTDVLHAAADAAAAGGQAGAVLTALEVEEACEQERLDRLRQKQREKKSRQKERQKAQRSEVADVAGGAVASGAVAPPAAEGGRAKGRGGDAEKGAADGEAVASQTPSQRVSSKLSVEALREQILAAQRERTRLQRQARQAAKRQEEENARAEAQEAELAQLRGRISALTGEVSGLEAEARSAEEQERSRRAAAEGLGEERARRQALATTAADEHALELQRLRTQIVDLQQQGAAAPRSFESERGRRVAAEERRQELFDALDAVASKALPTSEAAHAPSLFEPLSGNERVPRPRAAVADVYRRLEARRREHSDGMRELSAALSQQIQERDAELRKELDGVIGSGLPKLLEALQKEGLARRHPKATSAVADPDLQARLRYDLLKF